MLELAGVFGIERAALLERAATAVQQKADSGEAFANADLELFIEDLLTCDYRRADLDRYDRKCLEDVNVGHWELWYGEEPVASEGQNLVHLDKPLIARNPACDVHQDALIGIDFGTRSTIVSVQDGTEDMTLLSVGIGMHNKRLEARHYENPTIMEFINLEKFIADYQSSPGRPETSFHDLRVSHAAATDLRSYSENEYFDSFFDDIKQWCASDKKRVVRIIDQQKNTHPRILPSFVTLEEGDFNPLEIYAYYLGLYINNMTNGIYLDYVLSYPVNYSREVRLQILTSFKAGLWKSLPRAAQENPEVQEHFRVRLGVSEPAAYAITALKGYGFWPQNQNERYFYAIFDFGGGTTDFDFGIWRGSDLTNRREMVYDYVIQHINSAGDQYLGGENLLERLAYEIFLANNDFMRSGKSLEEASAKQQSAGFAYTSYSDHAGVNPPGCETTIKNTPSAKRNMKQLMEVLRPFWEGIIGVEGAPAREEGAADEVQTAGNTKTYHGYIFRDEESCRFPIVEDSYVTVNLFDNDGKEHLNQKLYIENVKLNISVDLVKILEERIESGVANFFKAFRESGEYEDFSASGIDEVQIFLAGNSSKSPILMKLFQRYCQDKNNMLNKSDKGPSHFCIYPPLGTREARAIQAQKEGCPLNDGVTAPTGKTGVAYGLLEGREMGKIKVISTMKSQDQSRPRFSIGQGHRGRFNLVLDRNTAVYGRWVLFEPAIREDFEIYYTTLPGAHAKPLRENGIKKTPCRIAVPEGEADIYVRMVEDAPEDLEYCVSAGESAEDAEVVRVHLKL